MGQAGANFSSSPGRSFITCGILLIAAVIDIDAEGLNDRLSGNQKTNKQNQTPQE